MSTVDIKTSEWLEDLETRLEYGAVTLKYDLAASLVAARKKHNLTQGALARIAGVSQAYIAKLESGEANPTIGRMGAILAAMWCKAHINLVPLVAPEGREETVSASASLGIPHAGGRVSATVTVTANDLQYDSTSVNYQMRPTHVGTALHHEQPLPSTWIFQSATGRTTAPIVPTVLAEA